MKQINNVIERVLEKMSHQVRLVFLYGLLSSTLACHLYFLLGQTEMQGFAEFLVCFLDNCINQNIMM